jgi:hypothetical protein
MPQPRKHADNAQRQAAYRCRLEQDRRAQLTRMKLPELPPIPSMPGRRRWQTALEEALHRMEMVSLEMRAYFDERSDAWREGERGEAFDERITALEAACSDLSDLLSAE